MRTFSSDQKSIENPVIEIRLVNACYYDYIINILLLKQAAGILAESDLLEINKWLE